MTCLYSFLRRHKVDFLGLSETNVDWRMIDYKDNVWGRMEEWFESKKPSVAHNRQCRQRETAYQAGGTISLTIDRLANVRGSVGSDNRGLGRWSWILVQGKGQVKTRFITVYCPCRNTKAGNSTYQQQLRYYRTQNMEVCPIQQFWLDLTKEVEEWHTAGDQIVLGGDWNHPITKVNDRLAPLGLREAITSKHGLESAPATHKRGSRPIDGIYVNSTLEPTRAGYLPFNKGIITDHRFLWMDIPLTSILGFGSYNTVIPKARRLKNKDPRIKKRYQDYLHKFAIEHNLYRKAASILNNSKGNMLPREQHLWKSFNRVRTQGMIAADHRCRKFCRGVYDWSPSFSRIRDVIKLWTMVRDRKNKENVSVRDILKIARRVRLDVDFGMTKNAVREKLDNAWAEYKVIKANAPNLRRTHLRSLAEAMAAEENKPAATKLRQLIHEEDQRRQAKAIKYTTGKLFGSGLTRVLVPSNHGNGVDEITVRNQLEDVLLRSNPNKYHRCESYCELMKGTLLQDIGLCGEGPGVQAILDGNYTCPDGTSTGTKRFIENMRRHPDCDKVAHISQRSSVQELRSRWKRAKESSSSNGKLHNGHFKAGFEHDSLRYLHYACAEILYNTGEYLDRHRQGTDVMLLKASRSYHLDKLRTICLLDAELNMNMGRVGTDGLDALLALGDMADEQYSRPCRSAIDHVVNRKLTFDYFLFRRRPYCLCSCDLAGNYDRIAHGAASLALQRVGVPLSRIVGLFDSLQRMIKRVRTAFGDSVGTYGGTTIPAPFTLRPMGVYQGNRIGPPIWSVISSTVFSILRQAGFGVQYVNALSAELYHLVGFAYVDDSDLVQTGDSASAVATDMQEALTLWEEVMRATGQSMAPEKSWWYLIDFVWTNGRWSYSDGATTADLVATNTEGEQVSLKRLIHSQAQKMLGVFLSPSGNKAPQLEYLRTKANTWADMIRVGHLGPTDTWVALSSGIWKSLLYPLPVTTFSAAELQSIISPIMKVALPRMSLARTTPLALRYGPRRLGGYGIVHLELYQGISKLQYLVEHPWRGTPTGRLINTNVSCLVLECGVYGNIFTIPSDPLEWTTATDTWVGYAWKFMSAHNIKVENYDGHFLAEQRTHDQALMSAFVAAGATIAQLQALNRCRIYLKVVSLSDIADASGHFIPPRCLQEGRRYPLPLRRNSFEWPAQGRPSLPDWKLWNTFVIQCFCTGTDGTLRVSLGDWHDPSNPITPSWDWHGIFALDNTLSALWNFDGHTWHRFLPSRRRTRSQTFCASPDDNVAQEFAHFSSCRASILPLINGNVEVASLSLPVQPSPSPREHPPRPMVPTTVDPPSFIHFLNQCSECHWFIKRISLSSCLRKIVLDFLSGQLTCVSDGSYDPKKGYGTANWRIESLDASCVISGYCIIPGPKNKQCSFRSELGGLLGLSAFIWSIAKLVLSFGFPPDKAWEVIVACDGYSALHKALITQPDRLSSSFKHFDVVSAIMGFWRDMPCSSFAVHVSAHQDEICPRRHLTRLELMNITTNKCARSFLHYCVANKVPPPSGSYSFGLPTVTYNGVPIQSELQKTLLDLCTEKDLRSFWKNSWKLSDHEYSSLSWPAFERAMGMTSRGDQKFVVKWLSRMVTVGVTMKRFRPGHPTKCLRCYRHDETMTHCIRCPLIRSYVLRALDHFYSLLHDYGTCPTILSAIKLCTHHWLTQSRARPVDFLAHLEDRNTIFTFVSHYRFGWYNFLQGLHFSSLTTLQQIYFNTTGSSKSVLFWHGRMISALWQFLLALRKERKTFLTERLATLDPTHPAAKAASVACTTELRIGLSSLPPLYSPYFSTTTETLLLREVSAIRTWLRTIRLAREALDKDSVISDDFSPNGCHRQWLLSF